MKEDNLIAFGVLLGALVMLILSALILVPTNAAVPQCQEDEVVTVRTYLWIKTPDECVNREDANYEFGYWTGESDA